MHPFRGQAKGTNASKFKAVTGKHSKGNAHGKERSNSDALASAMGVGGGDPGQMPPPSLGMEAGTQSPGMCSGGRLDRRARGGKINAKKAFDGGNADVVKGIKKYADGGRTKKGNNVTINIVSPKSSPSDGMPGAGGPVIPPVIPPPGPGIPPAIQAALAAKMAGAGGPPPGGPPMMPPPGGPPPGMKRGGRTHPDEAEDKAMIKGMVKSEALKAKGGKVQKFPKEADMSKKTREKHTKKMSHPPKKDVAHKYTGGSIAPVEGLSHKYPQINAGAGTGVERTAASKKYGLKMSAKG
jgi:hypothetical protein